MKLKQKTPLTRKTPLARTGSLQAKPKEAKPARGAKPKKCANRACRAPYMPDPKHPFITWCSGDCAVVIGMERVAKMKAARAKAERAADKAKRETFKSKNDYVKDAQRSFNAYIRFRDRDKPCICCGRTSENVYLTGSDWDCGHYRSTGSAPFHRFNEDNAHRQLVFCNRDRAGNSVEYRRGLIARIGLDRVEALENDNAPKHWSVDDLVAIRDMYRAKLRCLQKAAA